MRQTDPLLEKAMQAALANEMKFLVIPKNVSPLLKDPFQSFGCATSISQFSNHAVPENNNKVAMSAQPANG